MTSAGTWAPRLYVLGNRVLRAVKNKVPSSGHRASRLVLRATFLGLLSRSQLRWLGQRFWTGDDLGFARYRDDIYLDEGFNLRGLFAWERRAIDRHFTPSTHILLSSAGGGRELIALRRLGFDVDAFECSPQLVRSANDLLSEQNLPGEVQWAAEDACPETGRTYDGLIVGWGSYGLIQGRGRRIAFLCDLRRQLRSGAPVLLSFFLRGEHERRFRLTAPIANAWRRLLRRERVELGDLLEPIFFHFFTESELRSELSAGGFELAHLHREGYAHAIAFAADPRS